MLLDEAGEATLGEVEGRTRTGRVCTVAPDTSIGAPARASAASVTAVVQSTTKTAPVPRTVNSRWSVTTIAVSSSIPMPSRCGDGAITDISRP